MAFIIAWLLIFMSHFNINNMDCVEIIEHTGFQKLLEDNGLAKRDFAYQLSTNRAFIYEFPSGQIGLFPAHPSTSPRCLVFQNRSCFDDCVARDHFPIENYDRQIEDYDVELLRHINKNVERYQAFLNNRYGFDYKNLSREICHNYYLKVVKDKSNYPTALIALGAVMGETLRIELSGKWILKKDYGAYNPYYVPLLQSGDRIYDIYDQLSSLIQNKSKDSSGFFDRRFFGYADPKIWKDAGVNFIEL